jgi:hypothetical protein
MTSQKPGLLSRILNADRRVLYAITVVLLVIPLVRPLMLPLAIDSWTKGYYDTVQSLTPDSVVAWNDDIGFMVWGETGPIGVATLQHLFNKEGVKLIHFAFEKADAQIGFEALILPAVKPGDKKYGTDWVNLGFIPGGETAMSALAANFLYPNKDAYGNSLADLPLMKKVNSMKDVSLFIFSGGSPAIHMTMRQFVVPYNKPAIAGYVAVAQPDVVPYRGTVLRGELNGLTGAAQYEFLLGRPWRAMPAMDAVSSLHIFLLFLGVLVNAAYFLERKRGK